jgi:hypothetical protein
MMDYLIIVGMFATLLHFGYQFFLWLFRMDDRITKLEREQDKKP